MVKLVIICAQSAWQNFGPSYFQQSGGAHIALQLQTGSYHLLSCLARNLKFDKMLRKHLDFLQHPFFVVLQLRPIKGSYVGWNYLRAIFRPNILFWKGNNTTWWGSPGRSGSLAILNISDNYVCALTYVPCQILLQQFSLGTRPHKCQTQ